MRDENNELKNQLIKSRQNEQYIIGAITRAEETARMILCEAQDKAKGIVQKAKNEEKLMKTATEGCYLKLCRLKSASEEICRAVSKAVGEQEEFIKTSGNVRPFISVYESTHNRNNFV